MSEIYSSLSVYPEMVGVSVPNPTLNLYFKNINILAELSTGTSCTTVRRANHPISATRQNQI